MYKQQVEDVMHRVFKQIEAELFDSVAVANSTPCINPVVDMACTIRLFETVETSNQIRTKT